jgi:lysozyme-like protein
MALAGRRWLPREIADLLWSNGWRDENLLRMIATVLQESEGYEEAEGMQNRDKTYDWGLFQLNSGNERVTKELAFDPARAVKVARQLFLERGFQPWYGYTTGRYLEKDYMLRAIEGTRNFWRLRYGYPIAGDPR